MIGLIALSVRAVVVAWSAPRFPPTADGTFYHRLAERIATGLGYTWLWPDGVVTYAAHYPVGYPALVGALYAALGPHPAAAMGLNAVLGALSAVALHRLTARAGSRRAAAIAGLLVAIHPGLAAYTPALMTEGVTSALLACAAWSAAAAKDALQGKPDARRALALTTCSGLIMGVTTLVRPQAIVLAPLFAWIAWAGSEGLKGLKRPKRMMTAATIAAAISALAVCAPWTARNCARMKSCALVSVNGGWNLLIGADAESTGAWSPVKVPEACREVFDEAAKDACFGRQARLFIMDHPVAWLSLAPRKLAATFDYCGAAGWYLNASSPASFGPRAKVALGAIETGFERAVLLAALFWAVRRLRASRSRRAGLGIAIAAIGGIFTLLVHAWVSYLAFAIAALLQGRALLRGPLLGSAAVAIVATTIVTHAVFFGAGRYSLVVFPLLCGVAAMGVCKAPAS